MSAPVVLAIDVGNSRIKAGLFDGDPIAGRLPVCHGSTTFSSRSADSVDALVGWVSSQAAEASVGLIGGANPPVLRAILDGWSDVRPALRWVERPRGGVLRNRTAEPGRVGPDRLFDAVAANHVRPPGLPAVVIDSGTATTVNRIDADGAFLGGAIVAGFETVAAALHARTALLPRIDPAGLVPPPDPLGRDTESALKSGLYWGLVGGVKELVARLSEQPGGPPLVLLTGGAAPLLAPHLPTARVEPHLTLQGLVLSADFGNGWGR